MNRAQNVITVLEALIADMTPVINIDLATDNGDGTFTLDVCNTYWITEKMDLTIGGSSYSVQSFVLNESVTVSGASLPVVTWFQLEAPVLWHSTRRKVDNERKMQATDTKKPFVFLPTPDVASDNVYDSDVAYTADISPVFLVGYLKSKDKIDFQQDLYIDPMNAMADFFEELVTDQDDKFERPDSFIRKEWMNFGESAVWGNSELIFDQELSGVSLRVDLSVLEDYACECEGVPVAICAPVNVYVDDVLFEVAPSGSDVYVTTGVCEPAGNTMNGVSLTDIVAGTTKNFTIRYEDDSPVIVTTESDDALNFVGNVPNPEFTYDLYFDGVDTGQNITVDGTDITINLR